MNWPNDGSTQDTLVQGFSLWVCVLLVILAVTGYFDLFSKEVTACDLTFGHSTVLEKPLCARKWQCVLVLTR